MTPEAKSYWASTQMTMTLTEDVPMVAAKLLSALYPNYRLTKWEIISFLISFQSLVRAVGKTMFDYMYTWRQRLGDDADNPTANCCTCIQFPILLAPGPIFLVILLTSFYNKAGVNPTRNFIQENYDTYGVWVENYS